MSMNPSREESSTMRYYSPDERGSYVMESGFKRLSREKQIAYMEHWFHERFADPVNDLNYMIDERPVYLGNGPHYADRVLGSQFADLVSKDVLDAAVAIVDRSGIGEWAFAPSAELQERVSEELASEEAGSLPTLEDIRARLAEGFIPRFGDDIEATLRSLLQEQTAQILKDIELMNSTHGGIGHNQPPEALVLSDKMVQDVMRMIEEINVETEKSVPNVDAVVESTSRLGSILAWVVQKLDRLIDGMVTTMGSLTAKVAVALLGVYFWESIAKAFQAALEWLNSAVPIP